MGPPALPIPGGVNDAGDMDRLARLLIAFVLGMAASEMTRLLDIPGNGSWIAATWILGAVAAIAVPSVASFGAAVLGMVLLTISNVVTGSQYAGLAWLVVAMDAAVFGHGFLVGATGRRAWRLRTIRDGRVMVGVAIAVALVALFVQVALDLARNPA